MEPNLPIFQLAAALASTHVHPALREDERALVGSSRHIAGSRAADERPIRGRPLHVAQPTRVRRPGIVADNSDTRTPNFHARRLSAASIDRRAACSTR
jgi:hypothetical protein